MKIIVFELEETTNIFHRLIRDAVEKEGILSEFWLPLAITCAFQWSQNKFVP